MRQLYRTRNKRVSPEGDRNAEAVGRDQKEAKTAIILLVSSGPRTSAPVSKAGHRVEDQVDAGLMTSEIEQGG